MEYTKMLAEWGKRRKQIMRWRGEGMTIRVIAQALGISTQRVCQLMRKEKGK